MRNQILNLLTYTAIFIYVAVCMYAGVYFDAHSLAIFLIASISCPILAYYSLEFIQKHVFNYSLVSKSLTRKVTLQIVDPLLN